jgi:DNA-binding transcriptional ArsR family regulator
LEWYPSTAMATQKSKSSSEQLKLTTKSLVVRRSVSAKSSNKPSAPAAKSGKVSVKAASSLTPNIDDLDLMFDLAAETFRVMSAPMRLKIINSLCSEEKNVGQLLEEINATQPNMSQHLNTLFNAKILGRRREGVQIYYRIINERVVTLCRAVCTQIAIDSDLSTGTYQP